MNIVGWDLVGVGVLGFSFVLWRGVLGLRWRVGSFVVGSCLFCFVYVLVVWGFMLRRFV